MILTVGGSPTSDTPPTDMCEIIDFNASSSNIPVVRTVASISYARKFMCPVILPDGKLVITGGFLDGANYTNNPEMFDPVTKTWTTLPSAQVSRGYHQVALLLPDGRVWTAGTTATHDYQTEIFSPSYCFETRPTISGTPTVGTYGGTIIIPTPDAAKIDFVSLVSLQSVTHHYDANLRLIWLQINSRSADSVTVSAPLNANLAPPGYYMIHVLDSAGVPSIAKIIKIPGTSTEIFYNVPSPGNTYFKLRKGSYTRYGVEAKLSTSVIVNKALQKWTVYLRKESASSGSIKAVVRRKSDDAIVATFNETINAADLPITFAKLVFTLTTPYVIKAGDRILIEYSGLSYIHIEKWNTSKTDGSATRAVKYITSYSGEDNSDITGTMSSG